MLRFIGIVVVVLAVLAGIGYWRGWFHAQAVDNGDQKTLNVTVDKQKLDQDKAKAEQKVRDLEPK